MSNKIIYPILIIIFSVLIIYAIINKRQNNKLNKGIEKYSNLFKIDNINKENLQLAKATNTPFTRDLIEGNWTCDLTTTDDNYVASNFIVISLLQPVIGGGVPTSYGTITYNNYNYNINFLLNMNITAIKLTSAGTPTSDSMHIKFYNNLTEIDHKTVNHVFNKPETFNAAVSLYSNNSLINKFASYKVYKNNNGQYTVGGELYRIIKSNDIYISKPPEMYDSKAYETIIGNYKFPTGYISFSFGMTNSNILNTINTSYGGSIQFCIQRVFYSPTDSTKEIITKISKRNSLVAVQNDQIPDNIFIATFDSDKTANNLDSFFKPKSTILYFYKASTPTINYDYSDTNMITQPNSVLSLQNSAQNMVNSNISFNNLVSVQQIITTNYVITKVGTYASNMDDQLVIPFSTLYSLL